MEVSTYQGLQIRRVAAEDFEVWLAHENAESAVYHYGGTRLAAPELADEEILKLLAELAQSESGLKNRLINRALASEHWSSAEEPNIPPGFVGSTVLGGRCILRARTPELHAALSDPGSPHFDLQVRRVMRVVGAELNSMDGVLKLTPDFGRFAHVADILNEYTPHSIGIKCEHGGCGGKSSYTVSGVEEITEVLGGFHSGPLTVIGAAGAMGGDFLLRVMARGVQDLAACDLQYDSGTTESSPSLRILPAEKGRFTNACLERGGFLIAMTDGQELEHSDLRAIPPGTHVLLAHNRSFPIGPAGVELARQGAALGATVIPGQILTLGGALTSRLEYFWRQERAGIPFDKALAHRVVRRVSRWCLEAVMGFSVEHATTPLESLLGGAEGLQ